MSRMLRFFRSDVGVLSLLAFALFAFHVATNGQYGFHRDELQTLDDARHLDWGFVAYPLITPLLGRIELIVFGTSLVGFRVFSALAVSLVMLLTGLIARELGGNRHIQILAAIASAVAPISLVQGAVLQYVSFDYLWGVAVTYCMIRLLNSNHPRCWLVIGIFIGLGMETRYTMGFLALGLAIALFLTPARRYLRSHWLWLGFAISILLFLPNMIWQIRHNFPSLEFLSYLHARDLRQGRYSGFYREQLLVNVSVVTAPLVIFGLWYYFIAQTGRYRMLAWTFLITFVLFAVAGARSYYTAPIYPMLLASGSVALGEWLGRLRPLWSRLICAVQWSAIAVNAVLCVLLVMPVAPIGSRIWQVSSKLSDQYREEIGWPDLARAVARTYRSLPAEEQRQTGILAGNYGEAGALNLYGPDLGLPHAMGVTNSFWYRGYDPRLPQTVIVVGSDLEQASTVFETCAVAGTNGNPFGIENEESVYHRDILLCRNLRMSWEDFWKTHRRFG